MKKIKTFILIGLIGLLSTSAFSDLVDDYNRLNNHHNGLISDYNNLRNSQ